MKGKMKTKYYLLFFVIGIVFIGGRNIKPENNVEQEKTPRY